MSAPTCKSCGAPIVWTPAGFESSAHSNPSMCLAAASLVHAPVEMAVAG